MVEWLIRNMSEAAGKLVFGFMVCFFPPGTKAKAKAS